MLETEIRAVEENKPAQDKSGIVSELTALNVTACPPAQMTAGAPTMSFTIALFTVIAQYRHNDDPSLRIFVQWEEVDSRRPSIFMSMVAAYYTFSV